LRMRQMPTLRGSLLLRGRVLKAAKGRVLPDIVCLFRTRSMENFDHTAPHDTQILKGEGRT